MKLSIIIPVFNEEKTIATILARIEAVHFGVASKEIIVVNDGSRDKTAHKIEEYIQNTKSKIQFYNQKINKGKGAAVRFGIHQSTGDYIVIQDADLEYNPEDIKKLVNALLEKKGKVIYGTRLKRLPRFSQEEKRIQFFTHKLGNKFLSLITSVLYGQWITDMETCYKLFPTQVAKDLVLHAKGFEFEPELTAKLMKKNLSIYEVSITTKPRGYEEGKKLNTVRDGIKALATLVRYRFID